MTTELIRDFIYPLSGKAGAYSFEGVTNVNGTNYENFLISKEFNARMEWRLASGFNLVRGGDRIWAYFAGKDRHIRAVGRVETLPHWNDEWGTWAIFINWDETLTNRLVTQPIPYDSFEQKVPSAVQGAAPRTLKVLRTWMKENQSKLAADKEEGVAHVTREVESRLGQQQFRGRLITAYGRRCAISGCDIEAVLEAAHIQSVANGGTHAVTNGLILRADLHTLFDRGLITINDRFEVQVDRSLSKSAYQKLNGVKFRLPERPSERPLLKHFRSHRKLYSK